MLLNHTPLENSFALSIALLVFKTFRRPPRRDSTSSAATAIATLKKMPVSAAATTAAVDASKTSLAQTATHHPNRSSLLR